MPRPSIRVNGGSAGARADVAASSAVTATLDSTDGVRQCAWSVVSTDETTAAASYTLVQTGSVGQNVAFTALGAGTSMLLKVIVNAGVNSQTGLSDATGTSATVKVCVPCANGLIVGAAGEEYEHDATFGSTGLLNSAIRSTDALSGGALSRRVRAATTAALPANTRTDNVITASANGALTAQDGVTLIAGDYLLVQNEGGGASHVNNGSYIVTSAGSGGTPFVLTRASDFNESTELVAGIRFYCQEGTLYGGTERVYVTTGATINVDALAFEPFAYAPNDAQYLVRTASGLLTAETALDAITSTVDFASTTTHPLSATRTDAATAAVVDVTIVTASSSGTTAADFGPGCLFKAKQGASAAENVGRFAFPWTDVTGSSEDTKFVVSTRTGGASLASAAEISGTSLVFACLAGNGAGTVAVDNDGVVTWTAVSSSGADELAAYLTDAAVGINANDVPIQALGSTLGFVRAGGAAATFAHSAAAGSVQEALGVTREVTAAAAGTVGTGARIAFRTRDNAGTPALSVIATERAELTAVSGANLTAKYVWATVNAGSLTDWMTLAGDGGLRLHAYTTQGIMVTQGGGTGGVTVVQPTVLTSAAEASLPGSVAITALGATLEFYYNGGLPAQFTRNDASDNSVLEALRLSRRSLNPGAVGLGTALTLVGWHDGGDEADIGRISAAMTNAGAGSYAATLGFWASTSAGLVQVGSWATGATGLRLHAYGTGLLHSDGSGNISSSAIVNADVDAAAAIAGSKIDPAFVAQNVSTTGTLAAGATTLTVDDATTNDVTTVLTVKHTTSGTPANNIGARIVLATEDAGGNQEDACYITGILADATNGSEDSEFAVWTRTGGSSPSKRFYYTHSGPGIGGTAFVTDTIITSGGNALQVYAFSTAAGSSNVWGGVNYNDSDSGMRFFASGSAQSLYLRTNSVNRVKIDQSSNQTHSLESGAYVLKQWGTAGTRITYEAEASISTVNNTPVTLISYAMPSSFNAVVTIEGSASDITAAADCNAYIRVYKFDRRSGGTVNVSAPVDVLLDEDDASWDLVAKDASGTLQVEFTGDATNACEGRVKLKIDMRTYTPI
jgi:hypothetical protein